MAGPFPPQSEFSADEIESGGRLAPKWDAGGLVTAVATDAATGDLLMVAHMNAEALQKTLETGQAHYWSRSRRELWHKGTTSGNVQIVREIRIDCDQDAIWLKVEQQGPGACHVGYRSCFYRVVRTADGGATLEITEAPAGEK